MNRRTLIVGVDDLASADGAVLCRDVSVPGAGGARSLRRGTPLDGDTRVALAARPGLRVEVVEPEDGEISQPEASEQFARALAGTGIHLDPPHQGQVVLRAADDGLLRVDGRRVARVNRLGSALLATSLDGRLVATGDTVGIVKAARLWVPPSEIERVARLGRGTPTLRVAPFVVRHAAFLAGQRIRPANVAVATASLRTKLARFGTELDRAEQVVDDPEAIARSMGAAIAAGAEVLLVAGSIVLDPGDPFLRALERLRARVICRGAPIDPGTMFWVAYVEKTACFGLASCEMYGRLSILDLILPYALAGEPITPGLVADLGYGGLLQQTYAARRGEVASDAEDDA